MRLDKFCKTHNVDMSFKPANNEIIARAEDVLEIKFGKQLKAYLIKYGYLGYKSVEFYGIIQRLALGSDMVRQTKYLHEAFPAVKKYIALGSLGDGCYIMVDSFDLVWVFDTVQNNLSPTDKRLSDYIFEKLANEDEMQVE